MRKLIISMVMGILLMLAIVAPTFAIVHPAVPICVAHEGPAGTDAGGGPAGPLPDEAGRGAGGPGQVAGGEDNSGTNSPDSPKDGCD